MTADLQERQEVHLDLRRSTNWLIFFSLGLIFLGLLAIFLPVTASALFTSAIGWIAVICGAVMMVQAFQSHPVRGFWLHLLTGIFYVIAGLYMLVNIRAAVLALTFALGVLFIVEGIYTIIMAFTNRSGQRMSGLFALNGVVTLILGILVLNRFPSSALWLIGLYFGISVLMNGVSLFAAAIAVRRAISARQPSEGNANVSI